MMHFITYLLLPIIGSLFIECIIFYFMEQLGTNRAISRWQRRAITLLYIILSVLLSMLSNGLINFLMMLLIPVLGYLIYNRDREWVLYDLLLVIALFISDTLISALLNYMFNIGIITFVRVESYYIILVVVTRLLEFMVLRVLTDIIRRKKHTAISMRQFAATFLLPITSIVVLFTLLDFLEIMPTIEKIVLFIINIALLLIVNIYFTTLFDAMSRNNQLENELRLSSQKSSLQQHYYENLEAKYQNTRKLVHDIRNHIETMEHLYETQKNEVGIQYSNDIHEILNQLGQKYFTSDKLLNIILNDKLQQMSEKEIQGDFRIGEADLSFLREVDKITIFGNLLDNAIEAAAESKKKWIRLRISCVHDFLSITMENSSDNEPVIIDNHIQSSKKDHMGFGLGNITEAVRKYKGDIQYEWNDKCFTTRIMLSM